MRKMRAGIIGFGRFGRLLAKYLSEDFELLVFDNKGRVEKNANVTPVSLENTCKADIVIPCVPISEFENVIKDIAGLLNEGALVVDVCSVKEKPAELMQKLLPKNVKILATHPMFGPDSAPDTVKGSKIVLCRLRVDDALYAKVKKYLTSKGLTIIETTPKDHDEQIARSQILTHFIGRALAEFKVGEMEIDTEGYKRLLRIMEIVENDTWQLYCDMNKYNSHSQTVRREFMDALQEVNRRLTK